MKRKSIILMVLMLFFSFGVMLACDGDKSYKVEFVNFDGEVLQSEILNKGEMPEYKGETPQRPSDDEFDYVFTGWSPQLAEVTKAATYTAQFEEDEINASYTIVFKNYDGEVLHTGKVDKGTMPQYEGATPQKPSDDEYDYVFIGWSPELVNVTKAATYTAQYESAKSSGYQSGNGSESNPYIILSAQQLKFFADKVNGGEKYTDKYFALGADIDLGGVEWTPIGTSYEIFFEGNLDGRDFVVKNFVITSDIEYAGLFGYTMSAIQNLGVTDFTIDITPSSPFAFAGGLVGHYDRGEITNCYATGDVSATTTDTSSFAAFAGGLAGYNYNDGIITNCYAIGNVFATSNTDYAHAGGLVGYNAGAITNCYATGDVSVTSTSSSAYAGGLVGDNAYGIITNCYAIGNVFATSNTDYAYAGGMVGYSFSGTITNCYAIGNVFATSNTGYAHAGGLVGENYNSTITDCYATGDVSATSSDSYAHAGGLIGYNSGTIKNCFATGNVMSIANVNAYAGGLVGYNSGEITTCYRYEGQTFYRKQGANEYDTTNNTAGEPCSKADLNSEEFYTDVLGWYVYSWDFSDLNFDEGKYPVPIFHSYPDWPSGDLPVEG